MPQLATLDNVELPPTFKYQPYVPKKRTSTTRTANSVIVQAAYPTQIVHGDGLLIWNVRDARPEEFQVLFDLYNTDDLELYQFVGYWGDYLSVYFTELKVEEVAGRFFNIGGEFQVINILDGYPPYTSIDCIS